MFESACVNKWKIIPEKAREECLEEVEMRDLAAREADLQIWELISEALERQCV